jgi:hypothetical protein
VTFSFFLFFYTSVAAAVGSGGGLNFIKTKQKEHLFLLTLRRVAA